MLDCVNFTEIDIITITLAIFLTNITKQFIKTKIIYAYLPLLFIIALSFLFLPLGILKFKTIVYFILKCYALSILFYDIFIEKIRNIIKGEKK